MKVLKCENIRPQKYQPVRVKTAGNIIEVMYRQKINTESKIQKLDKENYIDKKSGEIKKFKIGMKRIDNIQTVKSSLAYGRDIINTNVTEPKRCRWCTFTYSENMQDNNKLKNDWSNCKYRLIEKYGNFEYITAVEPQARGAWHLHVIIIFPSLAPYMDNQTVADCWKKGFVKIKRLDTVDNIGAYLSAYLGDMEITEDMEIPEDKEIKEVEEEENGIIKKKRYIKGELMKLYPAKMHIFRWSNGIKKPEITEMTEEEAEDYTSSAKLTWEKTIKLINDENFGQDNVINYRFYNKKQKAIIQKD